MDTRLKKPLKIKAVKEENFVFSVAMKLKSNACCLQIEVECLKFSFSLFHVNQISFASVNQSIARVVLFFGLERDEIHHEKFSPKPKCSVLSSAVSTKASEKNPEK